MIYKRLLYILIGLYAVISTAQEQRIEIPYTFSRAQDDKTSYAIPNQLNDELVLITEETAQINAHLIDTAYILKKAIQSRPMPRKYRNIIGYYATTDKLYTIFFSNKWNDKFAVQQFDFKNGKATNQTLDFSIKNERYIECINYRNKLHLITITKGSSELNIYRFDATLQPQVYHISLATMEYDRTRYTPMDAIFSKTYPEVTKIEAMNPNVIETTAAKNKLYQIGEELIFSFDYNLTETKLCYINLNTFTARFKNYNKPAKNETGYKTSNSYLFDNKLFQITSSKKKMKFTVTDLSTDNIIKEYALQKEDTITFKNSPIIQEGVPPLFDYTGENIRTMEKTAKYLRKISAGRLGISVYKINDLYNIVLGGIVYRSSGGAPMMFTTGGFSVATGAGVISVAPTFNTTFYGYSGYHATKSTYINCLFDANFEHVAGDIPENQFDQIHRFEEEIDTFTAETIFLHRGKFHFGYLDLKDRMYRLHSFE